MEENKPLLKYIEKIVLEVYDRSSIGFPSCRSRRRKKFSIAKFNAKEAAYAFLREYDGEAFVKAQKIKIWHNNQELHLRVRDLIYGNVNQTSSEISNSTVVFIYRKIIFSEIKWPVMTAYRTNRVRWAHDQYESPIMNKAIKLPEIRINDEDSAIIFDKTLERGVRMVPCTSCMHLTEDDDQSISINSIEENSQRPCCRDCRIHRSVSGLERLISVNDERTTVEHVNDDENHFQSSIYIHVNRIHN
ncbi:hypothetical protein I4U23_023469 [Adineta vaga]|nr:hypothetical protein I4U23_023469 [Adineta vaga]